jgi:hypothetical protein
LWYSTGGGTDFINHIAGWSGGGSWGVYQWGVIAGSAFVEVNLNYDFFDFVMDYDDIWTMIKGDY